MHGQQAEISLRLDLAHQRQTSRRPHQVNAHQQRKKHPDKHRRERQEEILNADDFVIEAKNIFSNEPLRARVSMSGCRGRHLLFLRLPCCQPLVKIFLADDVYHAVWFGVGRTGEWASR